MVSYKFKSITIFLVISCWYSNFTFAEVNLTKTLAGTPPKVVDVPGTKTITTTSNVTSLKYDKFDVGQNETLKFVVPNMGSIVVNQISGTKGPSLIQGSIISRNAVDDKPAGHIIIANSNGIISTADSSFDVGSLSLIGGKVSNRKDLNSLQQGNILISKSNGAVVNYGSIKTKGFLALLGNSVHNYGKIHLKAREGKVILKSFGKEETWKYVGDDLIQFAYAKVASGAPKIGGHHIIDLEAGKRDVILKAIATQNVGREIIGVKKVGNDYILFADKEGSVVQKGNILVDNQHKGKVVIQGHDIILPDESNIELTVANGKRAKIEVVGETVSVEPLAKVSIKSTKVQPGGKIDIYGKITSVNGCVLFP